MHICRSSITVQGLVRLLPPWPSNGSLPPRGHLDGLSKTPRVSTVYCPKVDVSLCKDFCFAVGYDPSQTEIRCLLVTQLGTRHFLPSTMPIRAVGLGLSIASRRQPVRSICRINTPFLYHLAFVPSTSLLVSLSSTFPKPKHGG